MENLITNTNSPADNKKLLSIFEKFRKNIPNSIKAISLLNENFEIVLANKAMTSLLEVDSSLIMGRKLGFHDKKKTPGAWYIKSLSSLETFGAWKGIWEKEMENDSSQSFVLSVHVVNDDGEGLVKYAVSCHSAEKKTEIHPFFRQLNRVNRFTSSPQTRHDKR